MGYAVDPNLFQYTDSNPSNRRDPTGLEPSLSDLEAAAERAEEDARMWEELADDARAEWKRLFGLSMGTLFLTDLPGGSESSAEHGEAVAGAVAEEADRWHGIEKSMRDRAKFMREKAARLRAEIETEREGRFFDELEANESGWDRWRRYRNRGRWRDPGGDTDY